mgnify:CR=1 FL=1
MKDLARRVSALEHSASDVAATKPETYKRTWEGSLAMARMYLDLRDDVEGTKHTEEELLAMARECYSAPPFDPTKSKLSPELQELIDRVVDGD